MSVTSTKYDESRFSKENVSLSQDFPVKYATFNAYQMRDLIIRKLIEDPSVRNQVYPGSNISILVDLVATMYQTLSYQLNHAASESMFSQSQANCFFMRSLFLTHAYSGAKQKPDPCHYRPGYKYEAFHFSTCRLADIVIQAFISFPSGFPRPSG